MTFNCLQQQNSKQQIASPNSKGKAVLGFDAGKTPCNREFCFTGDFKSSLINVCNANGTNSLCSQYLLWHDKNWSQFCCCLYNALCFICFRNHASVTVLLMSLLTLLVAKLILSLYISLVIFTSPLMTNKRFHVVLPSLPETQLA